MINLLPPIEKENLLLEKKKRIVIILWILVLFFLVCLILILFSIKTYIQSQVESQKTLLIEAQKEFEQSEVQELRAKINSTNSTLTKLNSFYQEKIYLPQILERISATLPQEMHLTGLSVVFLSDKKDGIKVSLSGFAPTVEHLVEFKNNLDGEASFKETSFPPENWVNPKDIDFFVTFKVDVYEFE